MAMSSRIRIILVRAHTFIHNMYTSQRNSEFPLSSAIPQSPPEKTSSQLLSQPYWFVDLIAAAAAAGTSSSLGKISGSGPTGVILFISRNNISYPPFPKSQRRTHMWIDVLMTPSVMFLDMFK